MLVPLRKVSLEFIAGDQHLLQDLRVGLNCPTTIRQVRHDTDEVVRGGTTAFQSVQPADRQSDLLLRVRPRHVAILGSQPPIAASGVDTRHLRQDRLRLKVVTPDHLTFDVLPNGPYATFDIDLEHNAEEQRFLACRLTPDVLVHVSIFTLEATLPRQRRTPNARPLAARPLRHSCESGVLPSAPLEEERFMS